MSEEKKTPMGGRILTGLATGACLIAIGWFCGQLAAEFSNKKTAGKEQPPPSVAVHTVAETDFNPIEEFVGHVEPIQEVDILPQIEGYITEVKFAEGATVKAGDLLFVIDTEQFSATRDLREAEIAQAESKVSVAEAEVDRAKRYLTRLKSADARGITKTDMDAAETGYASAVASFASAQAGVAQAKANLALAEFNVKHTAVRAPIAGRIGKALVHAGDFVSPSKGAMARIVQVDPVRITFPITDRAFIRSRREATDRKMVMDDYFRLRVVLPDGTVYPETGKWEFSDNEMSTETATILLRFSFANPKRLLVPNSFVTVLADRRQPLRKLTVPVAALTRSITGHSVWVLDSEGAAHIREVELFGRTQGLAAIDKGLALDDVLATDVYGRRRVSGEAIDIGAAEFQAEVLDVEFARNKKSGLFGVDASFVLTPTVTGARGTVTLTWLITCDHGRTTVVNATTPNEPLVFEPATPGSFTVKLTADDGSGAPAVIEKADYVVAGAPEIFVDAAGGNVFPYATAATAAHDFNDAWAFATSGSVVRVAAGCYRTAKTLDLTVPIQVIGAGRDVTTIRLADGVNGRVVTLDHARSLVRGCTLSGGRLGAPSGSNGCGVRFGAAGGTVEDCRITDSRPDAYNQNGGGVAFVSGSKGVLRRSVVDGNVADVGEGYGGGVYSPGGGVVENCLIVSNKANWGGGVYLDGALYATNCTIAGNSGNGQALAGWGSWKNARMANLILRPQLGVAFGGNDSTNGLTAVFSHCAIEKAYKPNGGTQYVFPEENGNTRTVPEFVDAASGNYRLKKKSPLAKAGLFTKGMKDQTDLDGHRRATGQIVSIGCYQCAPMGLVIHLW